MNEEINKVNKNSKSSKSIEEAIKKAIKDEKTNPYSGSCRNATDRIFTDKKFYWDKGKHRLTWIFDTTRFAFDKEKK